MKKLIPLFIFLFGCLFSQFAQAETIVKEQSESYVSFATRATPANTNITHKPLTFSNWINPLPTIVAFYEKIPSKDDLTYETSIEAVAYIATSQTDYNRVTIDTYGSAGGNPRIESVFLSKNKKPSKRKLVVIVSWDVNHAGVHGDLYETYIYEPPSNSASQKFSYLEALSKKLSGGCDCQYDNGTVKTAKFKTAKAVLNALK
ncbi:MAG: hypothetical protein WBP13_08755 [Methylophilaceae bacterium]